MNYSKKKEDYPWNEKESNMSEKEWNDTLFFNARQIVQRSASPIRRESTIQDSDRRQIRGPLDSRCVRGEDGRDGRVHPAHR